MLEWAFTHPEFKTQLFRFVDVFPRCRDAADVLRHLSEYFDGVPVPRAVELGLDVAEQVPLGSVVSAAVARRNIRRMARQFIAGEDPHRAVGRSPPAVGPGRGDHRRPARGAGGQRAGGAAVRGSSRRARRRPDASGPAAWPARDLLERDPWGALPRVDVSVKPTALSPLFAPLTGPEAVDAATARLRPVLDCARGRGATVHLDTEHDEAKDLGYELLRRMGGEYPDVQLGCVVQAYRRDAFADLRDLVAWSATALRVPLRIRLVKGAYWDHEEIVAGAAGWPSPVFARKAETDANFERCTRYLIDHAGEVRPAIASHNLRSLAHAIAYARRCGLAARRARAAAAVRHGRAGARGARRRGSPGARVRPGRRAAPGDRLPGATPAREHLERELRPPPLRRGPGARRADPRAVRRRACPRRRAGATGRARHRPGRAGAVRQRAGRGAPAGHGARPSRARRR